MVMSITISGNASATPSCCPWLGTSVTGHRIKASPAITTSASTIPPRADRKQSPRFWNDLWTYPPPSIKTRANASASWSPVIWTSAMSTTLNLPLEVVPFDRAISRGKFKVVDMAEVQITGDHDADAFALVFIEGGGYVQRSFQNLELTP